MNDKYFLGLCEFLGDYFNEKFNVKHTELLIRLILILLYSIDPISFTVSYILLGNIKIICLNKYKNIKYENWRRSF